MSMIGREIVVEHDLNGGQGRIQIGDTEGDFSGQIDKGAL